MKRFLRNKRGQSTLEYAVIIAVVVAALIAMQFYFKRSLQGKIRSSSDDIGSQFSAQGTSYTKVTNSGATSYEKSEVSVGGYLPETKTDTRQGQNTTTNETVGDLSAESWNN